MQWILVGIGALVATLPALAANWTLTPSAAAAETFTHNSGSAGEGLGANDFVTAFTGTLQIHGDGARLKLNGSIAATERVYASHPENNSFAPAVSLLGNLEAIEKFAYVEAQASIFQSYISPFGPQPSDLATATTNRYTAQAYRVSPYVRGVAGSTLSYQLRDDNIWTRASSFGNSSTDIPNTYSNQLNGSISKAAAPWGWTLEYSRQYYDNGLADGAFTTEIARGILPYRIDPQLQISARGGHEMTHFPQSRTEGTIYGAGAQWSPTERTQVSGFWEHRFFGSSYSAQISHRLPNAALSANLSRDLNTYPQLALLIPAGADATSFLDAAFTTRIPDPVERAVAVQQFLAQTGLAPILASPVNFYTATIALRQTANVSLVLIGARNAVGFTVFHVKSNSVTGTGSALPPAFESAQSNTQTGAGINFSHRLAGQTNLGANATYSTTTPNGAEALVGNARGTNFNTGLNLSKQFSPKTNGSAGLIYSRFESSGSGNAGTSTSLGVYARVTHTF